jgi:hypothetical protein
MTSWREQGCAPVMSTWWPMTWSRMRQAHDTVGRGVTGHEEPTERVPWRRMEAARAKVLATRLLQSWT